MPYEIEYSPAAGEQLLALSKRDQRVVLDTVDRQLMHQPQLPTRNRKKLRPNLLADWELRIGNLRVYFVVKDLPTQTVSVVAIGVKEGNRVLIGGIEVQI